MPVDPVTSFQDDRASPFQKALFPNIYQKTQPGEAAFSYLKLRDWSFIYRMQNQVS
jgi:hypothetical protein